MKNLVVAVILAAAGTAAAQPAESPAQPEKVPTTTEWYGLQILGADSAVFATAALTHDGDIAFGWIGSGAVVHAAHGHTGRAIGSVAMRVGFPMLGLVLGASSAKGCTGDLCGLGPALAGGLIGMGAAEVVDLVDATDEREIVPVQASPRWQPVAKVNHSSATFGFAARF